MFWKKDNRPVAHKVIINESPAVFQKGFDKYGIVLEDDGETIWLYATDAKFESIYCSLFVAKSGLLNNQETYIVHNANMNKVGLYYDDEFKAIIDFNSKKACARSANGSGSDFWGNLTFNWESSFEKGLEP